LSKNAIQYNAVEMHVDDRNSSMLVEVEEDFRMMMTKVIEDNCRL